jgi:hypothetical protein
MTFGFVTGPRVQLENHRSLCHAESRAAYEEREISRDNSILDVGDCKTLGWTTHCECYVVTLYKRLEAWMLPDLRFCSNCRVFTYRCSKDNNHCGMNIRKAMYELAEAESRRLEIENVTKRRELWKKEMILARSVPLYFVKDAESSQMGAAESKSDVKRMQVTRERIQKEGIEEMSRKREEDLRKRGEGLRKHDKNG